MLLGIVLLCCVTGCLVLVADGVFCGSRHVALLCGFVRCVVWFGLLFVFGYCAGLLTGWFVGVCLVLVLGFIMLLFVCGFGDSLAVLGYRLICAVVAFLVGWAGLLFVVGVDYCLIVLLLDACLRGLLCVVLVLAC